MNRKPVVLIIKSKDFDAFMKTCENPPEPNKALKDALSFTKKFEMKRGNNNGQGKA